MQGNVHANIKKNTTQHENQRENTNNSQKNVANMKQISFPILPRNAQ